MSGEQTGSDIDLKAVTGKAAGNGGIAHGELLTSFAEAVLGTDDERLDEVRTELHRTLGDAALVDTAAVVASFATMDRVADATGIPLEDDKAAKTEDLRAELGLNEFEVARA